MLNPPTTRDGSKDRVATPPHHPTPKTTRQCAEAFDPLGAAKPPPLLADRLGLQMTNAAGLGSPLRRRPSKGGCSEEVLHPSTHSVLTAAAAVLKPSFRAGRIAARHCNRPKRSDPQGPQPSGGRARRAQWAPSPCSAMASGGSPSSPSVRALYLVVTRAKRGSIDECEEEVIWSLRGC
ncbi:hypothetical protein NL676_028338 [Syzygium grande]|nr:hypothetical protein NL676_028338 [Syzygium grande]